MLRLLAAFICTALLNACAVTPVAPPAPVVVSSGDMSPRQLSHWEVNGKVGLRFIGQNISATYRWQRIGDDFSADAAGPLNQGYTTLEGRAGIVTLENAWFGRHESADGEGLLQALTSIRVPLSHFNAWFMGWPKDSTTPVQTLTAPDGVREFNEYGWTVRIASEQIVQGYRLPERMIVSQDGTRLVLALTSWTPGTAMTTAAGNAP
ncbi:MAG: lipoprotein insertase outer membrane protein LolB [Pseudomonadota bacterium]